MNKHYAMDNLREIAGSDEDFMSLVAKAFLEEIPPDLKTMDEAIQNDNKDLVYQFAHKMKPNFEMFGIELQKDITAIESWTKTSKNKTAVYVNLEKVNRVLHEVFKELKVDFNL